MYSAVTAVLRTVDKNRFLDSLCFKAERILQDALTAWMRGTLSALKRYCKMRHGWLDTNKMEHLPSKAAMRDTVGNTPRARWWRGTVVKKNCPSVMKDNNFF